MKATSRIKAIVVPVLTLLVAVTSLFTAFLGQTYAASYATFQNGTYNLTSFRSGMWARKSFGSNRTIDDIAGYPR